MKQKIGILAATFLVALLPSQSRGQSCTPCPKPAPVQVFPIPEVYETITVQGVQNIQLPWDVYVPTSSAPPWPAVLVLHAGGFVAGSKTDGGVQRACADLAAAGFLALGVNYRLAGGSL